MEPKVVIVTLNWNGWRDTIECLDSILKIKYQNYKIIIVDNNSQDNSREAIRDYIRKYNIKVKENNGTVMESSKIIEFTEHILKDENRVNDAVNRLQNNKFALLTNEKNYGFAEGNNLAIKFALKLAPEYILLINNDTVVANNFLEELLNAIQKDGKIVFACPKIYYYDYKGRKDRIAYGGGHIDLRTGNSVIENYQKEMDINYITGACLLVRAPIFQLIGLFDSRFFTYWEETDLCIRGLNRGYKAIYVPSSNIWHKISASNVRGKKIYYLSRNKILFMKKNRDDLGYCYFLIYNSFIFLKNLLVYTLVYRDIDAVALLIRGQLDGIKMSVKYF